jgi:hypothetical protein
MKQENKNKNTTCANKNPTKFYYKKETKQGYDKKTYKILVLNKLKVMGNSTFIYTYQAPSSKKFFLKTSKLHMAHVYLCVNYELTRNEFKLN